MSPDVALRAEAALSTFLVEAPLWEDEERAIRVAINIVRKHTAAKR